MYLIFGDQGHCIRRIGWCNVKRPHFHSFDVCGQCGGAGARSEGAAGAGVARRPSAAVCAVRPRPVHAAAASRRRAARAPRTRHPRFTHTHPLIITTINPQNGMNIPGIARECECSRCLQYVVPPSITALRTVTDYYSIVYVAFSCAMRKHVSYACPVPRVHFAMSSFRYACLFIYVESDTLHCFESIRTVAIVRFLLHDIFLNNNTTTVYSTYIFTINPYHSN